MEALVAKGGCRILVVSSYPPTKCGIASYAHSLVRRLRRFVDVVLLTDREWRDNDPLLPLKVLAKSRGCDVVHIQHEFRLYGYPYLVSVVVVVFALVLLKLKKALTGKPAKVIVTMHSVLGKSQAIGVLCECVPLPSFLRRRLCLLLYGFLLKLPSTILVHTPYGKRVLIEQLGVPSDKVHVIPHGLEPRSSSSSIGGGAIRLLMFGFLRPTKGYEAAIKALKFLPSNFCLCIRGSFHPKSRGKSQEAYEKILQLMNDPELRRRIRMELKFASETQAFSDADIVLLPYVELNGASGVLCNAISHGKPVVVTSLPHFESVLRPHGYKWLAKPGDPASLANAILDLIQHYREAKRIILRLKDAWSWDKIIQKIIRLYGLPGFTRPASFSPV